MSIYAEIMDYLARTGTSETRLGKELGNMAYLRNMRGGSLPRHHVEKRMRDVMAANPAGLGSGPPSRPRSERKSCMECDREFCRPTIMRDQDWERQRYCSNRCKVVARRRNEREPETYVPSSDAFATSELHRRLMVMYERVANERDLYSVREAAIMLNLPRREWPKEMQG